VGMDEEHESFFAKGLKKCRNEPLVPFGAICTVIVLSAGLRAFKLGNIIQAQKLMRFRVAAQLFTVGAMGVGAWLSAKPEAKKNSYEEKLMESLKKNEQ